MQRLNYSRPLITNKAAVARNLFQIFCYITFCHGDHEVEVHKQYNLLLGEACKEHFSEKFASKCVLEVGRLRCCLFYIFSLGRLQNYGWLNRFGLQNKEHYIKTLPPKCWIDYIYIYIFIALWSWFSRDVLPVTCCEHGPTSIATVHFSKFSIATNILFN